MADGAWTGPVETVAAPAEATHMVAGRVIVVCDHASNAVPPGIDLELAPGEMGRHIAWDPGARGVTLGLARALGAEAVLTTFSRLVIDPNRGEDDPTLVMRLYDGTIIPGNAAADAAEVGRRLEAFHRPYHNAIATRLDALLAAGQVPVIVSIHSFTPQLRGRAERPWHVGLLSDTDRRVTDRLLPALARQRLACGTPLCLGDNEPYTGQLAGDCMNTHGTRRGIAHVLVEVRNDLIATAAGEAEWAGRLADALAEALPPAETDTLRPAPPAAGR
ncbi:MAG: N-formylglutamate amidohydrolase [Pseudomonadota bacterium]